MWIVNLALRRPYTFIVLALFILIASVLSTLSTPKDIFPSINIPVISVIFNFPGMSPRDLEAHLTTVYERVLTTTVDNIEHIESESLFGISALGQQLLHITIGKREAQIPTDGQENHLRFKLAPFEQTGD